MATDTMRIVVQGKNIDVTPALRDYAEKRMAKVRKYFPDDVNIEVNVVLSVERNEHIAEVTVHVQSLLVRAERRTDDMYASIDGCLDRVERQVRRHKNRLQRRLQSGPKLGELSAQHVSSPAGVEHDEDDLPKVVRTKRFPVKPMVIDEALMQMDLLGHDFFVFSNADSEQINVLYKRKDGNIGLIEPDYS